MLVTGGTDPHTRLMPIYRYWMLAALWDASRCADEDTQNAAIILSAEGHPREIARGRIEYPPGVVRSTVRSSRPQKYFFLEHAERNAILNAARAHVDMKSATMITPWAACADCVRAIIQSGITTLVRIQREPGMPHPRWEESIDAGDEMLTEAGVHLIQIEMENIRSLPLLKRNGIVWPS